MEVTRISREGTRGVVGCHGVDRSKEAEPAEAEAKAKDFAPSASLWMAPFFTQRSNTNEEVWVLVEEVYHEDLCHYIIIPTRSNRICGYLNTA